ncbi:hypothetical protein SI65_02804 [Aspergillus cristatus]|uniref:TATA element modulatory factor 1 TATA binding domain-containing protein n=1 Tax=Aspergillus cristatus TaxID=573508 RepID=A0A1E3BLX4_ASPCR|nr:hypothetical protein SI65_02804 [Aspergillus cristatus]
MAQNPQGSKPKWKVGSFLQQAVAGVESKLDLILAEEEEQKLQQMQSKNAAAKAQGQQNGGVSRSSSSARKNDRLQERLARAMVNKSNTPGNRTSQSSASAASSPAASPRPSTDVRPSADIDSGRDSPAVDVEEQSKSSSQVETSSTVRKPGRSSEESALSSQDAKEVAASAADEPATTEIEESTDTRPSIDESAKPESDESQGARASRETARSATESSLEPPKQGYSGDETTIAQLQAEHKAAESQWQEETHGYIERIDALQSKLKYLAKDAAESAKQAAASAESGSVEKQLREKDEKIALLLEEGQKLSKSEMDHRTALKKLRQQLIENSKSQTEAKKKTEKLETELSNAEARAQRAEAAEKRANDSLASHTKTSRDLEAVKSERNALNETIQEMKGQLARAVARAETAESKAQSDALEQEKWRTSQLEEELTNSKTEHDLNEEKLNREINDLKEKVEQEKGRARMLETELKGEQSVLESKMESLRTKAEEASSGAAGESQAKLLRQIETLQTQYAVASENWQTLEGSLLSRLANLEKERDDVAQREGELRRKVREVNLKAKKADEELEDAKEAAHDLNNQLEERTLEIQKLEQKLQKASDDLIAAQKDFTEQKKAYEATWTQKLEDERARWREQIIPPAPAFQSPRNESPVTFNRKAMTLDPPGSFSDSRPTSRRSSVMPFASPDIGTPPRQNSFPASTQGVFSPPVAGSLHNQPITEMPSIHLDPDEMSGFGTPSAYGGQSRGINDIISESTVGAGPSVQLVERMSAAVRRLESERAASKDELARITSQRDEARKQVVDLMRETDQKKATDARIQELEAQMEELDQRYLTTLEMLGEKSEQVEELQADIADLKKIYRELVDSTMK